MFIKNISVDIVFVCGGQKGTVSNIGKEEVEELRNYYDYEEIARI